MSARNRIENKQARRAEREARKGAFVPATVSFEVPETKKAIDEETGEEVVKTDTKRFYHLPSRKDRRGNRTRQARGKGI